MTERAWLACASVLEVRDGFVLELLLFTPAGVHPCVTRLVAADAVLSPRPSLQGRWPVRFTGTSGSRRGGWGSSRTSPEPAGTASTPWLRSLPSLTCGAWSRPRLCRLTT